MPAPFLDRDPNNSTLQFNLSVIQRGLGHQTQARHHFEKVLELEPEDSHRRAMAQAALDAN